MNDIDESNGYSEYIGSRVGGSSVIELSHGAVPKLNIIIIIIGNWNLVLNQEIDTYNYIND